MSKIRHAIYLAIVGALLIAGCGPLTQESTDDAIPIAKRSIAIFAFVPLGVESHTVASELTRTLIQSLEKIPSISVITKADLPPSMQDPSNHHRWPGSELVSLILGGSVRETEEGTMVTAQIMEASSEGHVWADTYVLEHGDVATIVADVENQVVMAASR